MRLSWTPAPSSACSRRHNPYRWHLPVTPGISTGSGFLFGGSGLGAAIEAMEGTTERPVVWATAQYLSYARPGTVMDIDVTVAVEGHQITQAPRRRARRRHRDPDGQRRARRARRSKRHGQWAQMPDGARAGRVRRTARCACTSRSRSTRVSTCASPRCRDFSELDGTPGDGRTVMWARMPEVLDMSGAALAILGDYVPMGVGQALGLAGRRQQPRQHAAGRAARADRVGAARHPGRTPSTTASATASCTCGPGRHAARDGEPVVHRPVLEGRTPLTSAVARLIFGTEHVAEVTSMLSSWARSASARRSRRSSSGIGRWVRSRSSGCQTAGGSR